ncbi:hypothetical protein BD626DRAFT_554261 [Schizophyllum amplum]|uniref:NmrA-like domain-containing protein n=1 Tax=Schizophyllum amplum TaxID=97359 RepID=A0A550CZ12_9AGAR|nr:hypothetical protein BD626DRAFT_554261 [Auriculariopsis ampla]
MPAGFKSIAIAGAQSAIGKAAVLALAATPGVSVLVLTRAVTARPAFLPDNVAHSGIDYADVNATTAILQEHQVQVVIAPLNSFAIMQQIPLADAAKAAGVQLFVPSEFGTVSKGIPDVETPPYLRVKMQIADHLQAIGLPYLRVFPGSFQEFIYPLVGYGVNKKVNILRSLKGDTPFSVTTCDDIGGFVAHVVTHHPLASLANKCFRIEGDRTTLNGLGAILDAPIEKVNDVPVPEGPLTSSFVGELQTLVDKGWLNTETRFVDGDGSGGANALWEGHHWTTLREFLKL